ncbi:hypothetical protein FRZ61_02150 [Hypericibacter adhaerens]|uniref:DUF1150 domain-containing protein n=1 Tax=Hypericibacter adhaerens TaxID=2602016 RepID=A0A5J6MRY2_9PROT|nr:DUF1150 family protein [Hypericibacter adhaerens]QEX20298.1 hypothetical protein FRZ61_02150 [Hypericibacter adhaerens]
MNTNKNHDTAPRADRAPKMSDADLAVLGLADVAYLRAVVIDGQPGFAVHAANGKTLGVAPTREVALAFIHEQELEPVGLH